jgi:hypothetical protein
LGPCSRTVQDEFSQRTDDAEGIGFLSPTVIDGRLDQTIGGLSRTGDGLQLRLGSVETAERPLAFAEHPVETTGLQV